jgi:SAM-dependent methyltransferase
MMMRSLRVTATDPTPLYRLRDGVYAADLLTVAIAELDLFTLVHEAGAVDAAALCERLELDARPADVMVTYLVALGLLERAPEGRVRLSDMAAEHLVAGSPLDLRPYFGSLRERPACGELLAVLRTGEPAGWASASEAWAERLGEPAFAQRITAAMDARAAYLGPKLAEALRDVPAGRVLDVGGGSGAYASALVDARRDLRATVFERPPVDAAARTLLAERGYADTVDGASGDMFADPLPAGHDLHLFSHVLHDWGEEQVRALLAASFTAMPPGGAIVDHDTHIDADKAGPLPVAEYSVLLMHSTPGKCWSVGELAAMLNDAGFADTEVRPTAADRTAIVAHKYG